MKKPTPKQPVKTIVSTKQPMNPREDPRARDARGSAGREEIRAQTPRVPAPRQSNRPSEKRK